MDEHDPAARLAVRVRQHDPIAPGAHAEIPHGPDRQAMAAPFDSAQGKPLDMYVPTFQGLSAFDLIRPANRGAACFPFNTDRLGFFRARNAIYYLALALKSLRPRLSILAPDYHSGNEILALRAAGADVRLYPVGRDMQPNLEAIERLCAQHDPDVLYVIHYLGWPQPMAALSALCRQRTMLLIEDCALSLLSEPDGTALGTHGDWAVFCLYKTLPVPNGALLVQNTLSLATLDRLCLRPAGAVSLLGRVAELVVQRLRARANIIGGSLQAAKQVVGRALGSIEVNRANVGDIGFNKADVDLRMSPASERLLQRFDFDTIRRRRVSNYQLLHRTLNGAVRNLHSRLHPGVCPLFYPIVVDDKAAAARALRKRGIQALEFWNHGADAIAGESTDVRYLRSHILALPVHQDLSPRHLGHMADCVARVVPRAA
jgi:dTDP-4-amino-4,6-dideoxygalactose transaminase